MILVTCPSCGRNHQAPEAVRGKRVLCKDCGTTFLVESSERPGAVPVPSQPVPDRAKGPQAAPDSSASSTGVSRDNGFEFAIESALATEAAPPTDPPAPPSSYGYGRDHFGRNRSAGPNLFLDFLTFRRMITPIIIQVVFWIGVALCILSGLAQIIAGASNRYGGGETVLFGLLTLFLGPLVVRIYCEILILVFRMNESLTDIRNNTRRHD